MDKHRLSATGDCIGQFAQGKNGKPAAQDGQPGTLKCASWTATQFREYMIGWQPARASLVAYIDY